MNIAFRKLAMIEKNLLEKEEEARIGGYTTNPVDVEFRKQISQLINKVKVI